MIRFPLTLAGLGLTAALAAGGVIVPVPRVPASALKPAPRGDEPPAEPEDPAAIADRIAENTKKAGDQLAEFDTGDQTRQTQEQILKDIDKLLNQPPMGGGGGGGSDQQNQNNQDQNPSGNQGQRGGQQSSQGGGMGRGGSGGGQRNPGGGGQSAGRQGRQQRREQRQQAGSDQQSGPGQQTAKNDGPPMPGGGMEPMPGGQGGNEPQPTAGGSDPTQPGGATGGRGGRGTPALPLDDAIAKQVWGHLPERLRQQMSQYYREQFMPKYGELLQEYYSALAEREKSGRK